MSGILNSSMMTTATDAAMDEVGNGMLDDLQLAAELGKTLLERNKVLELTVKQQQAVIEDRENQIEHQNKQINAMREVNDSRLRIYENLEVNIHDLEKTNQRLKNEISSQKKAIKTLTTANDTLESKIDDLNKQLSEVNRECSSLQRKHEKLVQDMAEKHKEKQANHRSIRAVESFYDETPVTNTDLLNVESTVLNVSGPESIVGFQSPSNSFASSFLYTDEADGSSLNNDVSAMADKEELSHVVNELNATRRQCKEEQQRVTDLEDQLNSLIQENQLLANRIQSGEVNNEIKSMQEELSILDDVRYGKLCSRCLRTCNEDERMMYDMDEIDSYAGTEDGDDQSLLELTSLVDAPGGTRHTSSVTINVKQSATPSECSYGGGSIADELHAPSPNLYRDLMQKYEAVLEVQRQAIPRNRLLVKSGMVTITSIPPSSPLTSANVTELGTNESLDSVQRDISMASTNSMCAGSTDQTPVTVNLNASSASDSGSNGNAASVDHQSTMRTPTADYSEAETSSSGFADETSNKHTQTDETLCFSLSAAGASGTTAGDAAAVDSSDLDGRFRARPEYRELFKEIFAILKKAADNKDAGEELPLLDVDPSGPHGNHDDDDDDDDVTLAERVEQSAAQAAAAAAAQYQAEAAAVAGAMAVGQYCDDTESVVSSAVSEQSVAMSERITKRERRTIMETVKKHCEKAAASSHVGVIGSGAKPLVTSPLAASHVGATAASSPLPPGAILDSDGRVLTPLKRDSLEYLSISVNARKKNRRKSRSGQPGQDRCETPVLPSPPRIYYTSSGKKRRDMRSTTIASAAAAVEAARLQAQSGTSAGASVADRSPRSPLYQWDGTSMIVYNRKMLNSQHLVGNGAAALPTAASSRRGDIKRTSAASQGLHKLFELDLSYAEVLRRADSAKLLHAQQQQNLMLQHQQQQKQQRNQRKN